VDKPFLQDATRTGQKKGGTVIELFACPGSGNCFKPWLAMTQLNQRFDLTLIDVLRGEQKSPEYLRINPLGVVPYLVTEAGIGIGESNAMLWYLADGSALIPADRAEKAEALQWMFFEQSRLEPYLSPARFFTTILPDQRQARAADIATWQSLAEPGLFRLDALLADRRFMLRSGYSIADIAIYGYVHVMDEAGLTMADFPAIRAWAAAVANTERFRPLAALGAADIKAA